MDQLLVWRINYLVINPTTFMQLIFISSVWKCINDGEGEVIAANSGDFGAPIEPWEEFDRDLSIHIIRAIPLTKSKSRSKTEIEN